MSMRSQGRETRRLANTRRDLSSHTKHAPTARQAAHKNRMEAISMPDESIAANPRHESQRRPTPKSSASLQATREAMGMHRVRHLNKSCLASFATSSTSSVAATGVKSSAEKAAAMPASVKVPRAAAMSLRMRARLAWRAVRPECESRSPTWAARAPPSCKAAASLPTDPEPSSVRAVPRRIAGASLAEIASLARAQEKTVADVKPWSMPSPW